MESDGVKFILISLAFTILLSNCMPNTVKKHYCITFENVTTIETKLVSYPHKEEYLGVCKVNTDFFTCTKINTTTKSRIERTEYTKMVPIHKCCDGYEEQANECMPKCSDKCENGICISPNQCKCNQNYILKEIDGHQKCQPDCRKCENGQCIAPNLCECADQWYLNETIGCKPICKSNCTNGRCIAPDNCVCNTNYYLNETLDACRPVCLVDCIFGECIAPDRCECNAGYRFKMGSLNECEPICERNCEHGKCVRPNECECDKDYQLNETEWNVCYPICDFITFCTNAYCSAPGVFDCFDGFELSLEHNCSCVSITDEPADLMSKATFDEPTGFKWWMIVLCMLIIVIICSMIVGLLIHRNRKIAYYLEDDPRNIVQYHYGEEEEVVEPETV